MAKVMKLAAKKVSVNVNPNNYAMLTLLAKLFDKHRGKAKALIAEVVTDEKPLKNNLWTITKNSTPTSLLNTEKIRADMSAEWLEKYTVAGTRTEYKAVSADNLDLPLKKVELTDELCDEVYQVIAKHARRQAREKAKEAG